MWSINHKLPNLKSQKSHKKKKLIVTRSPTTQEILLIKYQEIRDSDSFIRSIWIIERAMITRTKGLIQVIKHNLCLESSKVKAQHRSIKDIVLIMKKRRTGM